MSSLWSVSCQGAACTAQDDCADGRPGPGAGNAAAVLVEAEPCDAQQAVREGLHGVMPRGERCGGMRHGHGRVGDLAVPRVCQEVRSHARQPVQLLQRL